MATVYEPWTDDETIDEALDAPLIAPVGLAESKPAPRKPAPSKAAPRKPALSRGKRKHQRAANKAKPQAAPVQALPVQPRPVKAQPVKKPLFKGRPNAIGINWPIAGWLLLLHVGALAAPFTFTWQGLVLMFVLHWITGGLGVCLGYHRLLTHGSFSTFRPVRWLLGLLGVLSGEGSATDWVANHRKHHALSDQDGDPHSPHDGAWWSHMIWIVPQATQEDYEAHGRRWAPDIAKDRVLLWIGRFQLPLHFLLGIGLFAAGWALGGLALGASLMVWGLFVRLVFVLHSTWLVNSASHMWGYTNYESGDDSRNNWVVALFTYGEGWHNNHHAYPRMANHGHRWWEIDLTFRTVRLMQRLGLAWNVVDYKHKHREEPQQSASQSETHCTTLALGSDDTVTDGDLPNAA